MKKNSKSRLSSSSDDIIFPLAITLNLTQYPDFPTKSALFLEVKGAEAEKLMWKILVPDIPKAYTLYTDLVKATLSYYKLENQAISLIKKDPPNHEEIRHIMQKIRDAKQLVENGNNKLESYFESLKQKAVKHYRKYIEQKLDEQSIESIIDQRLNQSNEHQSDANSSEPKGPKTKHGRVRKN